MKPLLASLVLILASAAAVAQAHPLTPALLTQSTTELAPDLYSFGNFSARSIFVVSTPVLWSPTLPTRSTQRYCGTRSRQ